MFLAPPKLPLKVMEIVAVELLPELLTPLPVPLIVHWLLDTFPPVLAGPIHDELASLAR